MTKEEVGVKKGLATTDVTTNAVQVIKAAILQSQQRALKAINQEQLALYYGIGRYVSANTRKKNWGKGALAAISEQLRKELSGLKGFSERNLKNMRTFFEEWRLLDSYNSAVQNYSGPVAGLSHHYDVQGRVSAGLYQHGRVVCAR